VHVALDLGMSEWESCRELITSCGWKQSQTHGSKTFQYVKEKKTKVILLVTASERRIGQTERLEQSSFDEVL